MGGQRTRIPFDRLRILLRYADAMVPGRGFLVGHGFTSASGTGPLGICRPLIE